MGFDLRCRVAARGAKHVKDLDSVCVCWAKPVRLARVEFGDLSGADRGVAASENQAKRSGENIEPLVSLMGDESRILWGQSLLEDLDPPWVLRQRNDDAPGLWRRGFRCTRGSPVAGAAMSRSTTKRRYPERTDEFRIAPPVCDYLTSERRREIRPRVRGMTVQITVVEPSIAHSLPEFVAPSRSATCV